MKTAAEVLAEETVVLANNNLSEPEKVLEIATRLIHRLKAKDDRISLVADELTELGVEGELGLELV